MKQVTIFGNNLNATVFAKSGGITPASTKTQRLSKLNVKANKSLPILKFVRGIAEADKKAGDIFAMAVASIGKKGTDISKI